MSTCMLAASTHQSLLRERAGETEASLLESLVHQGKFMSSLVDTILDLSAIESGRLPLKLEGTDLVFLVKRSVDLNRIPAHVKDIELAFHPSEDSLIAEVGPIKMGQVLNNLIQNAVKYSDPVNRVEVMLSRDGDLARVSVRDEGGAYRARIWRGYSNPSAPLPKEAPRERRAPVWAWPLPAAWWRPMAEGYGWKANPARAPPSTSPCPFDPARRVACTPAKLATTQELLPEEARGLWKGSHIRPLSGSSQKGRRGSRDSGYFHQSLDLNKRDTCDSQVLEDHLGRLFSGGERSLGAGYEKEVFSRQVEALHVPVMTLEQGMYGWELTR